MPMTNVGVSSSLAGAEMMTFFAPALIWDIAFAVVQKAPVASIIYSAPQAFPWDAGSIAFGKDRDLLSVYGNPLLVSAKFTAEAAEYGIVPDHIYHIIKICVTDIDSTQVEAFRLTDGDTECNSADAAESVDANLNCHCTITSYKTYICNIAF